MQTLQDVLERRQIAIYFGAVSMAVALALLLRGTAVLESAVNPALALML